ncbi:MAG: hypothetical protein KY462_13465 [Actinobacteria bacterium]|nr:hypothetical protein [Actinomycetota bacterium]
MTNDHTTSPTAGVIGEAVQLYKEHWQHLVSIALLVYLVIAILSLVATAALGILGAFLAGVLGIVGVFWLQGALVRAVEDIRDGRVDLSIGETFEGVKPHIGPITGAGILAGIGIGIGLLLLLIPGLYLITMWSVLIPVIVLERRGVADAFGRSRTLVSGHGWSVFGVIILAWLVLIVAELVIALITAPFGQTAGGFLSDLIGGTVASPFVALVWTLVYFRLRGREGAQAGPEPT